MIMIRRSCCSMMKLSRRYSSWTRIIIICIAISRTKVVLMNSRMLVSLLTVIGLMNKKIK